MIFPEQEPCIIENANIIFGRRFGIPCRKDQTRWFIRKLRYDERLRIYSIPDDTNPVITRFP